MATTTVLHEYEEWLQSRLARGDISSSTYETYLNEASRVFEVMLRHLPLHVVEGCMAAAGYQGSHGHVINVLRYMARERGHITFGNPDDLQPRLPGV